MVVWALANAPAIIATTTAIGAVALSSYAAITVDSASQNVSTLQSPSANSSAKALAAVALVTVPLDWVNPGGAFERKIAGKLITAASDATGIVNKSGQSLPRMAGYVSGKFDGIHGVDFIMREAESEALWLLEVSGAETAKRLKATLNDGVEMSMQWRESRIRKLLDNAEKRSELEKFTGLSGADLEKALMSANYGVIVPKGTAVKGISQTDLDRLKDVYTLVE